MIMLRVIRYQQQKQLSGVEVDAWGSGWDDFHGTSVFEVVGRFEDEVGHQEKCLAIRHGTHYQGQGHSEAAKIGSKVVASQQALLNPFASVAEIWWIQWARLCFLCLSHGQVMNDDSERHWACKHCHT